MMVVSASSQLCAWIHLKENVKFVISAGHFVYAGVEMSVSESTDDLSAKATLIVCPLSVLSNWLVRTHNFLFLFFLRFFYSRVINKLQCKDSDEVEVKESLSPPPKI